ncbi:DNA recombination protein RmuC [Gammaproteobacteria bacterium]|nr:DNA recombination protein RmuC [Gammaproteobacteria bacterium]
MLIELIITLNLALTVFLVVTYLKNQDGTQQQAQINALSDELKTAYQRIKEDQSERQKQTTVLLSGLKTEMLNTLLQTLKHHNEHHSHHMKNLTESVHKRLGEISDRVNHKMQENFEKNSSVIQDVLKHLALIDKAQDNITNLSEQVVDLQKILTDKSSRGAYGEIQLEQLVANIIPKANYSMQVTLPNQKRVDCLLKLPKPSGDIAIDAKFPLENYRRSVSETDPATQKAASTQFKIDIKKHIDDIKSRYIIPNVTANGAIMFIPAEAIFAHIHAHHIDLVSYAQKHQVWICSPTTLMAVLNTAYAVIKDHSTKHQVALIKQHLSALAADFGRFDKRMSQLARHIDQAQADCGLIKTSSHKITQRFESIERCELPEDVAAIEN